MLAGLEVLDGQLDDALQRGRHQVLAEQLTSHLGEDLCRLHQLVVTLRPHEATIRPMRGGRFRRRASAITRSGDSPRSQVT